MASSTLLLLMVMTACVTVHAVSYTEKLESWNYAYYARNWAHLGSVTNLELIKVHTASPTPDCRANATFGFYGSTTWVNGGCRGDFRVSIDDTDTMEQKFDQLTEDVNNDAAKTVNLTAEVEAQNKVIAETRCAVALLNEDDPMHDCCCPHGWTLHQFDGDRICYRFEEHNIKRLTKTGGAEELCEALHPNATLPMPKTKAQIQVLKSFVSYYDYELEHIAIDRDETGDYMWKDGSAVDPTVIYPKNFDQYGQECGDTTEIVWSVLYDIMICKRENNYHIDKAQLCQIALTECPLNEE